MIRGTTPTLDLIVENADLTGNKVIAIIKQGDYVIKRVVTPQYEDPDTTMSVTLSQEETLACVAGDYIDIQVRFINADGIAGATKSKQVYVSDILDDEVISYED